MAFLSLLLGYLLGSIPSGYLAGRWCKGIDLRTIGSGSTGATNVLRSVGKGPALVVFLVDVAKGTAAVLLARAISQDATLANWIEVGAGLAALAGHIWPAWLGFKGGKAVATGFGMFLGLAWPVGLACFGVFLAVFSISRIVSLASVIASICLRLRLAAGYLGLANVLLAVVAMVLVLWRHRSNLQRLIEGTEPRVGQNN